jgi:DNA-binding NarL/FixJ family response regulator
MNSQSPKALIVTHSIVLQQGLSALLESLPEIMKVTAMKEISSAYAWIETHQPKLVLLDYRITRKDTKFVLAKVQELCPETRRVLLMDDVQEADWVPRYADAILIKGIPPQAVAALLSSVLSTKGNESEPNPAS